jgi:RNA polymerase sigma-70 factor (ECF subfamily)
VDEAELIARARDGDRDAQDALVRRYGDDVYRATYRLLGDSDLAQDAAQDAFISALRGLTKFRGDASFKTWLLRIALNSAKTMARRQTRRREMPLVVAESEASPGRDIADAVAGQSEGERLQKLLADLPMKQRMAVILRAQQGLSYAEVGAAIDCSEGAARVNYHLGIKRLKELAAE